MEWNAAGISEAAFKPIFNHKGVQLLIEQDRTHRCHWWIKAPVAAMGAHEHITVGTRSPQPQLGSRVVTQIPDVHGIDQSVDRCGVDLRGIVLSGRTKMVSPFN